MRHAFRWLKGSDLGTIEDAGLVHVIPDVQVLGAALEAREAEEASPPIPAGWVEAVHPG